MASRNGALAVETEPARREGLGGKATQTERIFADASVSERRRTTRVHSPRGTHMNDEVFEYQQAQMWGGGNREMRHPTPATPARSPLGVEHRLLLWTKKRRNRLEGPLGTVL